MIKYFPKPGKPESLLPAVSRNVEGVITPGSLSTWFPLSGREALTCELYPLKPNYSS